MKKSFYMVSAILALVLASLACGIGSTPTPGGGGGGGGGAQQISQWAASAVASSEYGNPDWAASQATGAPNTAECSDEVTAWASAYSSTLDWLELTYTTPVYATQVVIYQTYNPSQVVKVELIDVSGISHEVYTAQPVEETCPYTMMVSFAKTDYKVSKVRITVDQTLLGGWNEIDAVQLNGYDK